MPKMAINRRNEEKQNKSEVSRFLFKPFHIRRLQKQIFFPIPILIFWRLLDNADVIFRASSSWFDLVIDVFNIKLSFFAQRFLHLIL